ncbi:MAG: hypothetical protein JWN85_1158 [Gammaproteobacteria bacterium]|nr:hypothetical protein [Gammaproteobacteria bacterium]
MSSRADDLIRLYWIFEGLEASSRGKRFLAQLAPAASWPRRSVYFFFEPGEVRTGSGHGPRLVRIGTHALGAGARSTLHQRLRQHAGRASGSGGNHRGSIFRLLVGEALIARGDCPPCPSWGVKGDIGKAAAGLCMEREALAAAEEPIEAAVSVYLGQLPFLWLPIEDEPGPDSLRGFIERNVIALASGLHEPVIDSPSSSWLGLNSGRDKVRRSGLWNQRHVEEDYVPDFLDVLEAAVERMPL